MMMSQPTGYPKQIWVLTRSEVIIEDDKEVVNHLKDSMVGGTFNIDVAEKMINILKDHQGEHTMVRSDVCTLSTSIINSLPIEDESNIDRLMNMVSL